MNDVTFVGIKNGDRFGREFGFTDKQVYYAVCEAEQVCGDSYDSGDVADILGDMFACTVRVEDSNYVIGGDGDDDDDDDADGREVITEDEVEEMYIDMLNADGTITVAGYEFYPSRILREFDPTAFRCGLADFVDSISDEYVVEGY